MKFLDHLYNRYQLNKHKAECAEFPTINGRIMICLFAKYGQIKIGKKVVINSSIDANPVGGHHTILLFKGDGALIEIDDGAGISNATICAREHIRIGKQVFLGAGCKIFDTDFHSVRFQERWDDVNIPSAPVSIGDRAFIGSDAIILKGVTIGEESVIGAGALVAKSVPPGEIWGGSPAKFIKKIRDI
ncbi:MAG: acyltransferase [Planctomycetes bacterium]|nr:acyltransferase [Planctomycetota bacterium]